MAEIFNSLNPISDALAWYKEEPLADLIEQWKAQGKPGTIDNAILKHGHLVQFVRIVAASNPENLPLALVRANKYKAQEVLEILGQYKHHLQAEEASVAVAWNKIRLSIFNFVDEESDALEAEQERQEATLH
jgi:hypothetical protein